MAGQAAEQIIAGVVLTERLAVTMYGAIHRAQFGGQRNLRGLVVDPKLLQEDAFRISLTDAKHLAKILTLEHPSVVSTVAVETGGPEVVIVTRGGGRYVTVQDLIESAKARTSQGGKLAMPVAALIGKSVIEALATAHRAGVIHGAVHPHSVLVDEDGSVRLGDFIVGRALTIAVSQGADSFLWRSLAGYIAPELVVGEEPTPGIDVFAAGAMMFTMLSGESPPGALRVTPAIERLVQRALDTDPGRRYKTAADMLENLVEAIEDDRWDLAERGELIKEAGLLASDGNNIDDATEDLLASLGKSAVQVTKLRKDAAPIGGQHRMPTGDNRGLDALISDLDDQSGLTSVDDVPPRKDPISDIIRRDAAKSHARVPSLDDPDEDGAPPARPKKVSRLSAVLASIRPATSDERAALAAIGDLDQPPARRVARPIVDPISDLDVPPPRLRSRLRSAIAGTVVLGVIGGAGYIVYSKYHADEAKAAQARLDRDQQRRDNDALEAKLRAAQPDSGAIEVTSTGAGIWLRLGRTPLDTPILLSATQAHDLVLLRTGFAPTEAQVNGTTWTGAKQTLKAKLTVPLKPAAPANAKQPAALPLQPTTPVLGSTGVIGAGPVRIESTPSDAEAWLFIGANHAQFNELWAGREYEVAVVKPGFKTQHAVFKAEDWRDGGDPNLPIDVAKKKAMLSRVVELEPDAARDAKRQPTVKPKKGK